jgi:hypothetical protein
MLFLKNRPAGSMRTQEERGEEPSVMRLKWTNPLKTREKDSDTEGLGCHPHQQLSRRRGFHLRFRHYQRQPLAGEEEEDSNWRMWLILTRRLSSQHPIDHQHAFPHWYWSFHFYSSISHPILYLKTLPNTYFHSLSWESLARNTITNFRLLKLLCFQLPVLV